MLNGKGSIEKRDKEGYSWRLVISNGYTKEGKKIRYTKTVKVEGKTIDSRRKAAERQLSLFLAEIEKGNYIEPSKMTFEEFSNQWLSEYAQNQLQPKTLLLYRQFLELRIIPAIGHLKMQDIKPLHIQKFYSNLQETGIRKDKREGTLSCSTIKKYHVLLSSMFEKAFRWQIISYNPVSKIEPPKLKHIEMKYLTPENVALLLKKLESQPIKYNLLVSLAIMTGCRRGELLALKWKNIDFEKGEVLIRHSLQYIPGEGMSLKEPKNKSSIRNVSIPFSTLEQLKEYRKIQLEERLRAGSQWQESDFVFTQWDGKVIHIDTISSWFPEFIKSINNDIKADKNIPENEKDFYYLPEITFHGLRHTAATILIDKGLNIKAVSARLGHAQTSTTSNIYAHALQSADRQAADIMEGVFSERAINKKQA